MFSSCILVYCGSISVDKLHFDLSARNGVVRKSIVMVEILEIHSHRLVLRNVVGVLMVFALSPSSCKFALQDFFNEKRTTCDDMVDASWVSSLSPVLLVVIVAGEVEVHVEALHDGQDLGKEGVDIGLAC